MNRQDYQDMMRGAGQRDYEIYLNTEALLACQKTPEDLCNPDELQFMIVHQVEELWMKLAATTLLDVNALSACASLSRNDDVTACVVRNNVAQRLSRNSPIAWQWQRPRKSRLSNIAENARRSLGDISSYISRRRRKDFRANI